MNSNTSVLTNILSPWNSQSENGNSKENTSRDLLSLYKQPKVPKSFIWNLDDISHPREKINPVVIDLEGFFKGDKLATEHAAKLLRECCTEHGFFQVINHGIDSKLFNEAHSHFDDLFKLPTSYKLRALKKPDSSWGFSMAHSDRFSTNLPWKEMFSFPYYANDSDNKVVDYFTSALGNELETMGKVYQKYCKAMMDLCVAILELLAMSLGVEKSYYKEFFEDAVSSVRCNYYPPCKEAKRVLGTGPHCDPTSVTILSQDQVVGLEVFANNKWQVVEPRPDTLVVNLGDTFTALTNGKYKSCLHRAVVNESKERKSIAFFLCPRNDRVVRPPENISKPRKYPDFTWSDLHTFTQKHYRADDRTFENFVDWFLTSKCKAAP